MASPFWALGGAVAPLPPPPPPLLRLPVLILCIKRFTKNIFFVEKNPNIIMGVLKPKLLELADHLHRGNYGIMSLSETWLKPSTPSRLLTLPGYQLYRADRPDRRGYGGVALAARDGISATPIRVSLDTIHPNSKMETMWTLVKPDLRRQFIVCTVYRPPRRSVTDLTVDFCDLQDQFEYITVTFRGQKFLFVKILIVAC